MSVKEVVLQAVTAGEARRRLTPRAPADLWRSAWGWLRHVRAMLPEGASLPYADWAQRHRAIVVILWLHVLAVFAYGNLQGYGPAHSLVDSLPTAFGAIVAVKGRSRRIRSCAASLGLLFASAAFVHLSGGLIEAHFHFFVMLILVALYQDWVPYLLSIGFVVVEHGVVGVLDPHAVYDTPDAWAEPWKWAFIHAAFVLAASGALLAHWRLGEITQQERRRTEVESALRAQEASLAAWQQSREKFRAVVQHTLDLMAIVNQDGRIQYLSPSAEEVWGYTPDRLLGSSYLDLIHPDDQMAARTLEQTVLETAGATHTTELRMAQADGSWKCCEVIATNLVEQPSVCGLVLTCRDITERKAFEEQLQHMAFHDALTQLPNRVLFRERVEHAVARADRQFRSVAVLFVDLDNFKVVNDSLGHEVGDLLLAAVAERLAACIRAEDTVARLGGDEFALLLEEAHGEAEAIAVAERIAESFRHPIALDGHEVFVGASVGIALSKPARSQPDALLRNADLAMYRAKAYGKGGYVVFDTSMERGAMERLDLESDLRRALEQSELRVYYQPIVSLVDEHLVEVEALVRWQHPTRGLVSPADFIPTAEETGLIVPLGQWVLEEACRMARTWQDRYGRAGEPPLVMSVNLSARQFQQPALVEQIQETLRATGLDPRTLKLEVTESSVMQDPDAAVVVLERLKNLGIRIAIDDFGTGYSSLSYLRRFPVDTLKIDRSFITSLEADPQNRAIVRSVVALAKTLHLSITGEGIETEAEQAELLRLGCNRGQGYLFSRPVPAEDLERTLAAVSTISSRPSAA